MFNNQQKKVLKDADYRPSSYVADKYVSPTAKSVKSDGNWTLFPTGDKVHKISPEVLRKKL